MPDRRASYVVVRLLAQALGVAGAVGGVPTFCSGLFGTLQVATVTGPVAVFAKEQASRAPRHPSVRILAARVRGTNGHR
jgi:hypothetical protein